MFISILQERLNNAPGVRDAQAAKAGKGDCANTRVFITEGMRQCRNAFNATEFPKGSRRECSDGWVRIVYGLTENRQAVCLT